MYNVFRQTCERVLKIPHDPVPPDSDPASAQVFRAAPAYYKYRLVLWAIGRVFTLGFLFLFLGIANVALLSDDHPPVALKAIVLTVSIVVLLFVLAHALFSLAVLKLDYEKRWYVVTDRSLRVREGVVNVREMTVTYANIQNVSVNQGPIQRALGIADLQVETAGGGVVNANQKQLGLNLHVAWFRGIDNAEQVKTLIQDRLRRLKDAGLGDHDDHRHETLAPSSVILSGADPAALLDALRAVHSEAASLRSAASASPAS